MGNLGDALGSRYLVISVMGPHAGESERAIFERKINDVHRIGRTFWLINSHRAEPPMVQRLLSEAKKERANCYCVFIAPSSQGGAVHASTSDSAKSYSKDGLIWHNLPSGLSPVTGRINRKTCALVFDQLELTHSNSYLDLWNYADFFNQDLPISGSRHLPRGKKFIQGFSTVCAIKKDMSSHKDRMKSNHRRITAIGRICDPYCVYLR
jgi:hypothetical protein